MAGNQTDDLIDEIGKLRRQLDELSRSVGHVEYWHTLGSTDEPLLNSPWESVGGNYAIPSYYRDPYGRVWLKGRIAGGASGSVVFQLPLGYRPSEYAPLSSIANDALARLEIRPNGDVVFLAGTASTYLDLDGLNFKATL